VKVGGIVICFAGVQLIRHHNKNIYVHTHSADH